VKKSIAEAELADADEKRGEEDERTEREAFQQKNEEFGFWSAPYGKNNEPKWTKDRKARKRGLLNEVYVEDRMRLRRQG